MAILIKIEKQHLYLFVAVMTFLVASGVVIAVWTDPGQSHPSEQIKVTIGGTDYSLQEAIDGGLIGGETYLSTTLGPSQSMSYDFTSLRTGKAVIIAKGDDPGSAAGISNYELKIAGTTIDTGRSSVAPSHGGSRSFTLIGTYDVTQGTDYTVTVTASRQNVDHVKILVRVL